MNLSSSILVDRESIGTKLAGKYLTFKLEDEEYGIEILKVQEIIPMQPVTKVPRVPEFIRGIINLRGKVIPIIALRDKFGMAFAEDTEKTCIIVIRIEIAATLTITTGIIIDEVREVRDITADQIEETPSFGTDAAEAFIMGICKSGSEVILLLGIDSVLTANELGNLAQIHKCNPV